LLLAIAYQSMAASKSMKSTRPKPNIAIHILLAIEPSRLTSGAKAQILFSAFIGTTKVVPFQN